MKKRVFVLANLAFLVLAGCGKTSDSGDRTYPVETATDEKESVSTTPTPKPEKTVNKTKNGTFSSDINLSLLLASFNSTIKNLPVTANFAVNDDGLMNLTDGNRELELTADLTKANAYESDGTTISSTDAAINNIKGFQSLLTIPESLSSISSFFPFSLSSVFPGQYKAMGYEFTKMVDSLEKAGDETAKSAALKALGQENVSFYLNDEMMSASETHSDGTKSQARSYIQQKTGYEIDTSFMDTILEVISALQDLDISELQKLDFVSLLENIENGDLITDDLNETLKEVYATIKKVGDIFVGGIGLEKTGKENEDGTTDAGFRLYLNEYGLGQLKDSLIETITSLDGVPDIVGTLLSNLEFTDFSIGLDLYRGLDEYTHFGGFDFDLAFSLGTAESNITISLDMDHDSGEKLDSDYFKKLEEKQAVYQAAADGFESYYDAIGSSVEYYDGDFDVSNLDITKENGEVLQAAVDLYDTLDENVKFMLTDAVKKDEILKRYNEGRKALTDAITSYRKEKTPSMATIASTFDDVAEYASFKEALKEEDEELYYKMRTIEDSELTAAVEKMKSYIEEVKSLAKDATDTEIEKVLKTGLNNIRSMIKDYQPTSFFGITSPAKYSDKIFFGDDLIAKKDAMLLNGEGSDLYQVEISSIDYFISHMENIVTDTTKTSEEIVNNFSSFSKSYVSTLTSTSSMIDSAVASDYLHAEAMAKVKADYLTAVSPYIQEQTDKVMTEYQKYKADPSTLNKAEWTVVSKAGQKALKNIANRELAVFGEMLTEDDYDFMNHLVQMGNKI